MWRDLGRFFGWVRAARWCCKPRLCYGRMMSAALQTVTGEPCLPHPVEHAENIAALRRANLRRGRPLPKGQREPALYERAAEGVRGEFGENIGMVARAVLRGIKTKTIDAASDDPVAHSAADPAD